MVKLCITHCNFLRAKNSVCRFINNFLSNLSKVNHPLRYLNLSRTVINHKRKVLMKDILQTIYLKLNPTLLVHILICLHFSCILHIEPVAQDGVAEKVEDSEVEVQEELQELEAVEQVENQEF